MGKAEVFQLQQILNHTGDNPGFIIIEYARNSEGRGVIKKIQLKKGS